MSALPKEIAQIDNTFTSKPDPTGGTPGTRLAAGLYYSTNANPRTYGDTIASLSGTPETNANTYTHTINIYDLVPNNKYYTQGYATNATGTYIGSVAPVTLNTLETVQINSQIWSLKNCDVTRYSDGTPIPYEPDATKWQNATSGAWCYYQNNPANGPIYGKLYNWYAVAGIHDTPSATNTALRKSLAPKGYHVPTNAEWTTLTDYLGGESVAGGKMKATGISLWKPFNTGATNGSGFSGFPGGHREFPVSTLAVGTNGFWWSSSEYESIYAWYRNLNYSNGNTFKDPDHKRNGFSVRFISDAVTPIGQQLWSTKNLDVSKYKNGDDIPQATSAADWEAKGAAGTGAWCYSSDLYANDKTYGKLYNWYAVNDSRGLAPIGTYIPSDDEWTKLTDYLGGESVAGQKLKSTSGWFNSGNGTNTNGFTALPGGSRSFNGSSGFFEQAAYWWSSTQLSTTNAWARSILYLNNVVYRDNYIKPNGFSIRVLSSTTNQTSVNITGTSYNQTWSKTNLDVATYRDGTPIPQHTGTDAQWAALTTGAWCYYANSTSNGTTYGKLYNWYAVNDSRGLAPIGWRIPSDAEWTALNSALGGYQVAGGKMKESGTSHWKPTNTGADNSSNFTALPGGYRSNNGTFGGINSLGYWWTSSQLDTVSAFTHQLSFSYNNINRGALSKIYGFSVRLIRDYA